MEILSQYLIVPVMYFMSGFLFLVTVLCMYGLFTIGSTSFIVTGCVMFILGYNAFRFAHNTRIES